MTCNQGCPSEVKITMPEIVDSDFIREQRWRLKSATDETKKQGNAKPLIQRVPSMLYSVKEDFKKYFEPMQVALGPLHHGNRKFEQAEKIKLKLAGLFVRKNGTTDKALFDKIYVEIEDLKKFYNPEDIEHYNNEKLAWMFFVDGCALLYTVYYGVRGDFKKLNIKLDALIFAQLDLFMLENQLPYRVLKILIASTKEPLKWKRSITNLIDLNINTTMADRQMSQKTKEEEEEEEKHDYTHLLERLQNNFLKGRPGRSSRSKIFRMFESSKDNWKTLYSIKVLKQSGIYVKPSKSKNLKNISFNCKFWGYLEMPRLLVDDSTASKFMNLVALEKCQDFESKSEVTTYLCFLGSLIETAEDVKELRATGMLHNYYGNDEEVANLIRKMNRDLVPNEEIYKEVTENIQRYCNSWLVWIGSHYFSRNWSIIAFLGVITGLILTGIQTYFSVNPKKR